MNSHKDLSGGGFGVDIGTDGAELSFSMSSFNFDIALRLKFMALEDRSPEKKSTCLKESR